MIWRYFRNKIGRVLEIGLEYCKKNGVVERDIGGEGLDKQNVI